MHSINNDTALSVHITTACNLHCRGCFNNVLSKEPKDIKLSDVDRAIELVKPETIILFGGEASMRPDLIEELMSKYPDKKYVLHTNGTLYAKAEPRIKKLYDSFDNLCATIDSFNYEWLKKNKGFKKKDYDNFINLIKDYRNKIIVTHNVFASRNDRDFSLDAIKYGIPKENIDWYPFITKAKWQEFFPEFRDHLLVNIPINTKPKLRVLTNGLITRDMREDKAQFMPLDADLPIGSKCKACPYFGKCPACNMFPHFCKDILESVDYVPHFCRLTQLIWRYEYGEI